MAQVALIGASGAAGSRIHQELSHRGQAVTGIARHPEKVAALPNTRAVQADVYDAAALAQVLRGHDAVVSAVHFTASDPQALIDAVRAAGVRRYLVVGGAGSLWVAPGLKEMDSPAFPEHVRPEARRGRSETR